MKRQLYLDCDGVLADFDSAAHKLFGMPPRVAEEKIGTPAFWARIRHQPNFYRDLALMPDARELFDAVAHLGPVILTGCPRGADGPSRRRWSGLRSIFRARASSPACLPTSGCTCIAATCWWTII